MFGNTEWKKGIEERFHLVDQQLADFKKAELELRSQNMRLTQILRNLGRKLVMRLPISIESLDKGLSYDLIYADEIELWREATRGGMVLDIRNSKDFRESSIPDSENLPYDQISLRLETLSRE